VMTRTESAFLQLVLTVNSLATADDVDFSHGCLLSFYITVADATVALATILT
jgi:hypothetical protein